MAGSIGSFPRRPPVPAQATAAVLMVCCVPICCEALTRGVVADAPGMAVKVRQTRRGALGVLAPSAGPPAGPAPVPADVAALAAPAKIAATHGPGRVRVCGKNKGLGFAKSL